MAVVVIATIHPLPEHRDAVRDAFLEVIPLVHAEDGCELYALNEGRETFVMVEQWTSREALAAHSKGAPLATLAPKLEGKLAAETDVQLFTAVPAGDPAKGAVVS